jgi:hypothetical protein
MQPPSPTVCPDYRDRKEARVSPEGPLNVIDTSRALTTQGKRLSGTRK